MFFESSLFLMIFQSLADLAYAVLAWLLTASLAERHPNIVALLSIASGGVMFGVSTMSVLPMVIDRIDSHQAMQLFTAGFLAILLSNTLIVSVGVVIKTISMQRRHQRCLRAGELIDLHPTAVVDDDDEGEEEEAAAKQKEEETSPPPFTREVSTRMSAYSKLAVVLGACLVESAISAMTLATAETAQMRRLVVFSSISTDWTQAIMIYRTCKQAATLEQRRRRRVLIYILPMSAWVLCTPLVWLCTRLTVGAPAAAAAPPTTVDRHNFSAVAALEALVAGVYTYLGIVDILVPELQNVMNDAEHMPSYAQEEMHLHVRYRSPPVLQGVRMCARMYLRCVAFIALAWFGLYFF